MGLLDDAIREHLDLKRRRGADPAEVARLEQEALGPVRREPVPAAEGDAAPVEAAAPPAAAPEPAAEGVPADDQTRVLPPEERHEGAHGDPLRDHVAREPDAGAADRSGGGEDARPPAEGPVGAHPEPTGPAHHGAGAQDDPRHSDIVHQPTTEFRVEDHHDDEDEAPRGGQPADDVLEETPDFLQETPEHDRLWFEQRPPRDFDFDG